MNRVVYPSLSERKRRRSELKYAEQLKKSKRWTELEVEEMLSTLEGALEELELLFNVSLEFDTTSDLQRIRSTFQNIEHTVTSDKSLNRPEFDQLCRDMFTVFHYFYANHYNTLEDLQLCEHLDECCNRVLPLLRA